MKLLLRVSIIVSLLCASTAYSKVTYLHSNPLGSIVAATDEAGIQLWVKRYTPYGIESEAAGTVNDAGANHGFATHEVDKETGLVYMKARYYDPVVGKFVSRDPIQAGLNFYAYGNNNPVNMIDPDGCEAVRMELNLGILGINGTVGLFISYPSPMGGLDRFDLGGYYTANPFAMPASLVMDYLSPNNPIAGSSNSIGVGSARFTVGLGWSESRDAINGTSFTAYGGGGVPGWGGSLSWDPSKKQNFYIPEEFDINFGMQGAPWLPFNAGVQVDYTFSYSVGDFLINYAYPAIDSATNGWFSGSSSYRGYEF